MDSCCARLFSHVLILYIYIDGFEHLLFLPWIRAVRDCFDIFSFHTYYIFIYYFHGFALCAPVWPCFHFIHIIYLHSIAMDSRCAHLFGHVILIYIRLEFKHLFISPWIRAVRDCVDNFYFIHILYIYLYLFTWIRAVRACLAMF